MGVGGEGERGEKRQFPGFPYSTTYTEFLLAVTFHFVLNGYRKKREKARRKSGITKQKI